MDSADLIQIALRRLSSALDQLEAAAERAVLSSEEKRDLTDTLTVMQDDRGRLANELDMALTRKQSLEEATDQVAMRLGRAGGLLRRLLAEADAVETETQANLNG